MVSTAHRTALVIEDDAAVARIIRDYLEANGFTAAVVATGEAGLRRVQTETPGVIILDLGLPGRSGLDVLRTLRSTTSIPVLIVTARGEEADRISGLELGADDYIVKPFSPRELVARVRAVLRRSESGTIEPATLAVGPLTVDLDRMVVDLRGEQIDLTATEFRLLAAMARRPGHVFTRAQLQDVLYGDELGASDRTIDAHIKNIRRKVEIDPSEPSLITTVHGVGYRLQQD